MRSSPRMDLCMGLHSTTWNARISALFNSVGVRGEPYIRSVDFFPGIVDNTKICEFPPTLAPQGELPPAVPAG